MKFDGTTVVVTGGAQGLGLAIAKVVLQAGACVALVDIDENALKKAKISWPMYTVKYLCAIFEITYGATKWAMTGFTKALRESLIGTGIRVSGFFPGGIETNLYENAGLGSGAHGQPWMMSAEKVAEIVLFVLTRPADMLIESLTVTKFTG